MKLQALIAAAITALALTQGASAASPTCDASYWALVSDLQEAQRPHREWVAFLEAHPWYPVPADVVSIDAQRQLVGLYDWRLYAVNRVAIDHDPTAAAYLVQNFEEHRSIHWYWSSITTYSGPQFHLWTASNYSTRIAHVQTLVNNC